jgi:hypothetical protein
MWGDRQCARAFLIARFATGELRGIRGCFCAMAFCDGKGMRLVYCDELSRQGSVGKVDPLSRSDLQRVGSHMKCDEGEVSRRVTITRLGFSVTCEVSACKMVGNDSFLTCRGSCESLLGRSG